MFKKSMLGILFFCFTGQLLYADTFVNLKEFLKKELTSDTEKWSVSKESVSLDAPMVSELKKTVDDVPNSLTFFYAKVDGQLKKACASVPQKGKEGPMTVGICFLPEGKVASVTVLTMEEDHGKPVKEDSFVNQFKDKSVDSSFEVGKDVDAVSGATTSSKAMAEAVRKTSFVFKKLVLKK